MNPEPVIDKRMVIGKAAGFPVIQNIVEIFDAGLENRPHAEKTGLERNKKGRPFQIACLFLLECLRDRVVFRMGKRIIFFFDMVIRRKSSSIPQLLQLAS